MAARPVLLFPPRSPSAGAASVKAKDARWALVADDSGGPPRVLLYDDDCGLCARSVEFVARRDPRRRFRVAPLASPLAQRLMAQHGVDATRTDSMVLVQDGRAFTRSSAAVRVLRGLRAPWPLAGWLAWLVPRPLRDLAYDFVARRRRRWFGDATACPAPSAELRARLLARDDRQT